MKNKDWKGGGGFSGKPPKKLGNKWTKTILYCHEQGSL